MKKEDAILLMSVNRLLLGPIMKRNRRYVLESMG